MSDVLFVCRAYMLLTSKEVTLAASVSAYDNIMSRAVWIEAGLRVAQTQWHAPADALT